jgi:hypothetical protein
MHRDHTDARFIWGAGSLGFMLTLVMVANASSSIVFKQEHDGNSTSYTIDTSDLPEFLLHSLAYYVACFATTVFLLICALIILSLATLVMELLVELFHFILTRRAERAHMQQEQAQANENLDIYCDSWNYR